MKAIIENKLSPITSTKACAFSEIIVVVIDSRNETELRKGMNAVFHERYVADYFEYGFGHNHVWVMDKDSKKRMLFAEF